LRFSFSDAIKGTGKYGMGRKKRIPMMKLIKKTPV
jgi:hypothetical protein